MRGFRKIEQGIRIDKSLKIQKANKHEKVNLTSNQEKANSVNNGSIFYIPDQPKFLKLVISRLARVKAKRNLLHSSDKQTREEQFSRTGLKGQEWGRKTLLSICLVPKPAGLIKSQIMFMHTFCDQYFELKITFLYKIIAMMLYAYIDRL